MWFSHAFVLENLNFLLYSAFPPLEFCHMAHGISFHFDFLSMTYCLASLYPESFEKDLYFGKSHFLLLQCQSLIEELSASHSTDLQQRAYELQAVIGLDVRAIGSIMPSDASCEDIEVILFYS